MGSAALTEFAIVYGVAIAQPEKPKEEPARKRAKETAEKEEEESKEEAEEADDDRDANAWWYGENHDAYQEAKTAFKAAHEKAFGRSAKTGLRLAVFTGTEERDAAFQEVFVIEHEPSRRYRKRVQSGCAQLVSLANLVVPLTQVQSDICKLLKDGLGVEPEGEPGWMAIATCTYIE